MAEQNYKAEYTFYSWKGIDKNGVETKGTLKAESLVRARALLQAQNINITVLKQVPTLLIPGKAQKKIKTEDISLLFRQLATMVAAGIPLVQALEFVAAGIEGLKMYSLVMTLHKSVSAGNTLADALKKYPQYFGELISSLVRVGEKSGTLETVLHQISGYLERMAVLRGRVKKAMFYPVMMFSVMIVMAVILLAFIVPRFENMFKSFGKELPGPTQVVLNMSRALTTYWWVVILVVIGIVIGFSQLKKRSAKFQRFLAKASINMWLFGPLMRKTAIARSMRTLSITLSAGIPLVEALECVARVSGNLMYTEAITRVREEVMMGSEMNVAMQKSPLFPAMVIQMISIGEKSGALETMLKKVAEYFDEQVDTAVDGLSTLIEPLMIITLGIMVGGFVVSMYLPIFKIGTAV